MSNNSNPEVRFRLSPARKVLFNLFWATQPALKDDYSATLEFLLEHYLTGGSPPAALVKPEEPPEDYPSEPPRKEVPQTVEDSPRGEPRRKTIAETTLDDL